MEQDKPYLQRKLLHVYLRATHHLMRGVERVSSKVVTRIFHHRMAVEWRWGPVQTQAEREAWLETLRAAHAELRSHRELKS